MPKYADPAVYPVTAPAADDTAMARTNAGGDRNFLLGNLAALAPLAMAADQSVYSTGPGLWATYSLTTAGRALSAVAGTANTFPYFSAANVVTLGAVGATGLASLAAATAATGRTAIGAADDAVVVHKTGSETIEGIKTWNALARWNLPATGSIEYGTPNGSPGIVMKSGNPINSNNDADMWRHDIRALNGQVIFRVNNAAGNTPPSRGMNINFDSITPGVDNLSSAGIASQRFTQVFAANATINTSDARLKTEPRQLRDAEFKVASAIARLPAVWRWLNRVHGDENCEPEGMEARKHFGPTVQAAITVMESHGLDPFAYSFICYDEWEAQPEQWHEWPNELDDDGNVIREAGRELVQAAREAGDRYSFRKEELLCFLVAAMARQHDELAERVAALEAKLTP